ncbi:MAG: PAS domain S-box protein, partial [Deltaproteobacteria bacterium]|nr:PAS domain S-box protein [Deltaproteobacteria bacterium]
MELRTKMSLRKRLGLYMALVATCLAALLTLALYFNLRQQLHQDLESRLYNAAALAALQIDASTNAAIDTPGDLGTPAYRRIRSSLRDIQTQTPDLGALYTLTVKADKVVFAVDPGLEPGPIRKPGTMYDRLPPGLEPSDLRFPVVTDGFFKDDRGMWITAYAPLRGADGVTRGLLRMDMSANSVMWREWRFLQMALPILAAFVLAAWVVGLLLGRSLARPIEALKEGAQAVAGGDLDKQVPVTTADEVGELAAAFNSMTSQLSASRRGLEQEIAERKQAQEALAESEKKYRTLYEDAQVGLYKSRFTDGTILACNNRFAQMLGFADARAAEGKSIGEKRYVQPWRRDELTQELSENGSVDAFEALFLREDGSTFWIRFSARLVDGGTAVEGMAVDFTREKSAIDALKAAEKKYRGIFENALEGIFQCGPDGRFLVTNPSLASILGYDTAEDLLEAVEDTSRLFAESSQRREFFRLLEETGMVSGMSIRFTRADGALRWGWVQARTVEDPEGGVRVEGMLQDITERTEAEAMQKARAEAEAANRAKNEFLGAMSHEMRTPMTAIVGMTELLSETGLTPEQENYVQTLRAASDTLLALIGDIQDLARLESGCLALARIPFKLLEVVEKTCEVMAVAAHESNLELTCKIAPETPVHLLGDSMRVQQVLATLVQNAVEFTTEGVITVQVGPKGQKLADGREVVDFSVTAPCQNLDPATLTHLFDTYAPAAIAASAHHRPSRLGLRLARELVRLMGGGMQVESRREEGTTFRFSAAFFTRAGRVESAAPAVFKGLSVLLADGDENQRAFVRKALNAAGSRVTEAGDAAEALALLKDSWMLPKGYDVVIVDGGLPGGDLLDLVEQIKVDHLSPSCVVIFGEDHTQSDLAKARAMGMDKHLTRP